MRTCISCRDPIPETKRKDAKYCDKAACRGREYRKRQAVSTGSRTEQATPHTSTVLTCLCGRQYRLHITEIHTHEPRPVPELPSPSAQAESLTQTVLHADPSSAETASAVEALTQTVLHADPSPAETAPASGALTQTVLHADPSSAETAPADGALTQTDRTDPQAPDLATLEMYFTDGENRRIPFGSALYREQDDRWLLRPKTRVAFGFSDGGQRGLGGRPGAWPVVYGSRSPTEHGYDPDLVVMNWDYRARRGRVISINILRPLLGEDWKQKLREIRDGKR